MSASFWQTLAVYCDHLAPIANPLLTATSRTAAALHNAECEARELEAHIQMYQRVPQLPASPEAD